MSLLDDKDFHSSQAIARAPTSGTGYSLSVENPFLKYPDFRVTRNSLSGS